MLRGCASSSRQRLSGAGVPSMPGLAQGSSTVSLPDELACRGCGKVHPDAKLITLPDGTLVGNYSEAYRAYCEAKWVLDTLPVTVNRRRKSTPQISRREYIVAVGAKRGDKAMHELADNVRQLWKASK